MAKVYNWKKFDPDRNVWETRMMPRAGTREAIHRAQGEPIEETGREVGDSELDGDGFEQKGVAHI